MFYLSFENSICNDYITEKFWPYLNGKLVPIVLGGADYNKVAPPHSFINAMNYPNPKDLADHLKYLISNNTAYNEFFQWIPYFDVYKHTEENYSRAFCQVCAALNEKPNSVYEDINHWWREEGNCKLDLPWSKIQIDPWKDFTWETGSIGKNNLILDILENRILVPFIYYL